MKRPRWWAAVLLSASLAACGGGGGGGGSSTGGGSASSNETATGTVTGFGSVIVEGQAYDDSTTQVTRESDSAAPVAVSVSDLRLGMRVRVNAENGTNAATLTITSEVIGSITSLLADGFVVAGQTVRVSTDPVSPTVFEGASGLADLAVNDRVEVYGERDSAGVIIATRIERRDPNAPVVVRVVGTISSLNTTSSTFSLGGLTVRYNATTRIVPAGTTLADGVRVAVWSDAAPAAGTLTAKSIVIRPGTVADNTRIRVGGWVRNLDFAAKTFRLDGFDVNAATATFLNGTANDLANGRRLRVRGTYANGVLSATEVRYVRNQGDAKVELTGLVTDFVSAASFKVRGVPIDASGAGVTFLNGDATGLQDGVAVKIDGAIDANVVKPTSVTLVTTPDGRVRAFVGTVNNYNATAGTFNLFGIDMQLTSTASFSNADGTPAARSDFSNTDRVKVRGSFVSGVFVVTSVTFLTGPSIVINNVGGLVYELDAAAGVFRLNGTLVRFNGSTIFEGSSSNLRSGTRVVVSGTLVSGQLVAGKIEIIQDDGSTQAGVTGDITDYQSPASFRVNGQRVDATNAAYVGGTAANLANGVRVDVRGPVVGGILTATTVKFRP